MRGEEGVRERTHIPEDGNTQRWRRAVQIAELSQYGKENIRVSGDDCDLA